MVMVWFQVSIDVWTADRERDGDDDELQDQETRGNERIGRKERYGGFLRGGRKIISREGKIRREGRNGGKCE